MVQARVSGTGSGMRRLQALRPLRPVGHIRSYNRRSFVESEEYPGANNHDPGLLWTGLGRRLPPFCFRPIVENNAVSGVASRNYHSIKPPQVKLRSYESRVKNKKMESKTIYDILILMLKNCCINAVHVMLSCPYSTSGRAVIITMSFGFVSRRQLTRLSD
ncbi:hypothetical protein RR48_04601 [Papilio machaon]|uniref:Uncharacterized protein n=1 Tax=Papilio machaon TaxID=76193 RepID=A0A0N1INQ0_PAPMA|nr:hypothetical protein RR48_04601 [Papilio machaon]